MSFAVNWDRGDSRAHSGAMSSGLPWAAREERQGKGQVLKSFSSMVLTGSVRVPTGWAETGINFKVHPTF